MSPHLYIEDRELPADHRGDRPCKCGRPQGNGAHDQAAVAKVDAAQAEHLRRIGEDNR